MVAPHTWFWKIAFVWICMCCVLHVYFIPYPSYSIPYTYGSYHTLIHIWYYCMHMVCIWLFVPCAYSNHTITVYKQHIAIVNMVLLFILDHELYPRCSGLAELCTPDSFSTWCHCMGSYVYTCIATYMYLFIICDWIYKNWPNCHKNWNPN